MINGKSVIAIIPARGGSKSIPQKNIIPFAGAPLISWTISEAKNSVYVDEVVVSTDSKEIADISLEYGAKIPFFRPANLSQDRSETSDTLLHAINFFEGQKKFFDILLLLEPTSPIRSKNDIDNALKKFSKNLKKSHSLITIAENHVHPNIHFYLKDLNHLQRYEKSKIISRRQDLDKTYSPFGGIYISSVEDFKKNKTFYTKKTLYYKLGAFQAYEVDEPHDLPSSEAVFLWAKDKRLI